jgi:hypothetical protein
MKCNCNTSTGICGTITRGTGKLDFNGYWEFPCLHGNAYEVYKPEGASMTIFDEPLDREIDSANKAVDKVFDERDRQLPRCIHDIRLNSHCDKCFKESMGTNQRGIPYDCVQAMRALEFLTPGGSEFAGDIKRCVDFVRSSRQSQMNVIVDFSKRAKKAEEERDAYKKVLEALPLDSFGDDMSKCDAADFVDHSGEFFKAMELAKKALGK